MREVFLKEFPRIDGFILDWELEGGRELFAASFFLVDPYPTHIASVNLVISCNKVFFHYYNTSAGVLTLHK